MVSQSKRASLREDASPKRVAPRCTAGLASNRKAEVGKERWKLARGWPSRPGKGRTEIAVPRWAPKNSSFIQYQHKSQIRQHRVTLPTVFSAAAPEVAQRLSPGIPAVYGNGGRSPNLRTTPLESGRNGTRNMWLDSATAGAWRGRKRATRSGDLRGFGPCWLSRDVGRGGIQKPRLVPGTEYSVRRTATRRR